MNAGNCSRPDGAAEIDGGLIGGAALKPVDFSNSSTINNPSNRGKQM